MPSLPDPLSILSLPISKDSAWGTYRQQFLLDWQQIREFFDRSRRRPDAPSQAAVAADTIPATEEVLRLTAAGATLMVSTPTIAAGEDGMTIMLVNLGAGTITFQDEGTLPGSLLRLRAGTVAIPAYQTITLYWADEIGAWIQVAP